MTTPIPLSTLFCDREAGYQPLLKSQRYALELKDKSEGPRLFELLFHWAVVEKFPTIVLREIEKKVKKLSDDELLSQAGQATAWAQFSALCQAHCSHPSYRVKPDMESAAHLFHVGFKSLVTHMDKSQELPQHNANRDSLFKHMGKQLGFTADIVDQYDANMLLVDPYDEALPSGVTMSAEQQAELGIVCSSSNAMITSVGNAGTATIEHFFMMRWSFQGHQDSVNLFSVMGDGLFDQIALLAGVEADGVDESTVLSWLTASDGIQRFLATLYVLVQSALHERMGSEQLLISSTLEGIAHAQKIDYEELPKLERKWPFVPNTSLQIAKNLKVFTPTGNCIKGRGIKAFYLRDGEGEDVLVVPLINAGIMRDIQAQYASASEREDPYQWRKLFNSVSLGGNRAQNSGTFFTAFMFSGHANVLNCPLSSQNSGLRVLKDKINRDMPLYSISRSSALDVCARAPQKGAQWLSKPLSRSAKVALERRLHEWLESVADYLLAVNGLLYIERKLSLSLFRRDIEKSFIRAERNLVLGMADDRDIDLYANYLRCQLYAKTHLTLAEKTCIARCIKDTLKTVVGAM
jgi:hypothetical protein